MVLTNRKGQPWNKSHWKLTIMQAPRRVSKGISKSQWKLSGSRLETRAPFLETPSRTETSCVRTTSLHIKDMWIKQLSCAITRFEICFGFPGANFSGPSRDSPQLRKPDRRIPDSWLVTGNSNSCSWTRDAISYSSQNPYYLSLLSDT